MHRREAWTHQQQCYLWSVGLVGLVPVLVLVLVLALVLVPGLALVLVLVPVPVPVRHIRQQ